MNEGPLTSSTPPSNSSPGAETDVPASALKSGPTAECILVLKQRFLDEQASVTDMTWYVQEKEEWRAH